MEFELRQDATPPITYIDSASTPTSQNVGDAHIIAAHRAVICARCPWFRRCLSACNNMQEARNNRIILHDVQPQIFDVFLRFLYSGMHGASLEQVGLTVEQLADLLLLADRYECVDFLAAVESALVKQLSEDSAMAMLGLADRLGDAVGRLRRAAFDYLASRPHLLSQESLASDSELPEYLR